MEREHLGGTSAGRRLLALRGQKREALDALLRRGRTAGPIVRAAQRVDDVPLSYGQQRLWFLDQWERGSAAYNVPAAVPLHGRVDVEALRHALTEILARHSALRTVFRLSDHGPVQVIRPETDPGLRVVPVDGAAEVERRQELVRLATAETRRSFDLANGPLFRSVLFRLGEDESLLLMTLHHIVSDGWSLGVLFHELQVLYEAFSRGAPSPLGALPIQYSDFAVWQRETLTDERLAGPMAYWRRQLEGAATLQLPLDRPRPPAPSHRGAQQVLLAPAEVRAGLEALNRRERVTTYMTLLAAFQVLLHRYSGQHDVVVGSPIAGRNCAETERLIGFFVNSLVLRTDLGGDPSFRQCLQRVRKVVLDAFDHQDVPFEQLVRALRPERDLSRNPLFQVTFQLFGGAQSGAAEVQPLAGSIDVDKGTALFDLAFNLWETARGIEGRIEYSTDLFDAATIARMADHFVVLLRSIGEDPDRRIGELPLLTAAERRQVVVEWNATGAAVEDPRGVHELVAAQAARGPQRLAVAGAGGSLTYGELARRAAAVARSLAALGVGRGTPVGVCLERSPDLIAAMLGVLEAGGAYLPLDPRLPPERLRLLVRDTGAPVVIAGAATAAAAGAAAAHVLRLDLDLRGGDAVESGDAGRVGPHDLAYLIYTSGSTGAPKGVEVDHGALRNLVDWHRSEYGVGEDDRAAHVASISFDAAGWEIWPYLAAGAAVALPDEESRTDPPRLLAWLAEQRITLCFLPTPLAEAVLRLPMPPGLVLRHLLTGGDRLRERPPAGLPFRVTNHYGPTENTVVTTSGAVEPGPAAPLPAIGRPIRNNQVFILDSRLEPVPVGVAGELFAGGSSLARGYRNRPQLTAERFLPSPFGGAAGARLYRTGDLARWRADGGIEYLGRSDRQIKVRGFRIEPGEVEAALASHPAVGETVVTARPDSRGDAQLLAYVVPAGGQRFDGDGASALRAHLARLLPDAMIPAAFVTVEALPLTAHGKVDLGALPAPEVNGHSSRGELPATAAERVLADLWREVLRVDRVGVEEDFFADQGGHSLLAVALASRIRDAFGVELPLRALFEAPTIRALAARLPAPPATAASTRPAIPRRPDPRRAPCSFAQQRLWFLDRLTPGKSFYNVPAAIRLETAIDPALLQRAIDALVERHEALRTTLDAVDGEPVQRIAPALDVPVAFVDVSALPSAAREAEALRLATVEARRPFDLAGGVLLRCALLRLGERDHVLLVTLHHAICDGWSVDLFFRELSALYEAALAGEPSPLAPLPVQYGDYALWQRQWLTGDVLQQQLGYWKRQLAGAPVLQLPTDRPRPALASYDGSRELLRVDPQVTALLEALGRREGATPFMTLLAAFATLLCRYSGQPDVVVGTISAGRNHPQTEGVLGLFANMLVLRADLGGNPTFRQLLGRVREAALDAYAHPDLPFERLVEELQPQRDLGRHPLVQVTFQLLAPPAGSAGPAARQLDADRGVATFDLALDMWNADGALHGRLEYSTDLFEQRTAAAMLRHFEVLLAAIAHDPDETIERLPLLTPAEVERQLVEWNHPQRRAIPSGGVHEAIAAQALHTPEAVAVEGGGAPLTCRQLDRRAGAIARHLRGLGVEPGAVVGVALERSPDWVAAVLGVLHAGAAFLPVDPAWPPARLHEVLDDARASVTLGALPDGATAARAVDLAAIDGGEGEVEGVAAEPGQLAYLLYTSGSTGRPKGVMVEHGSLASHAWAVVDRYGLQPGDRVLQFAPLTFDVALEEVLPTLAAGATVVLRPGAVPPPPRQLAALAAAAGITVLNLPASYWHQWVDDLAAAPLPACVRLVIAGSERVDPVRVARWLHAVGRRCRLMNAYGTTETTITALVYEVPAAGWDPERPVPIGRPLANVESYVLDRHLQPVPVGVTGDLYVGGAAVARGYLGHGAAGFQPSPFGSGRLYRTGDRAYYLADGNVVFRGRADQQLKVRGVRVEPAEVAAAIMLHPAVRDAVVTCRDDATLVAYVVGAEEVPRGELLAFLRTRLPEPMLPSAVVHVDRLPAGANGKVDLARLPPPDRPRLEAAVEPATAVERAVAALWQDVLGVERPDVDASFFELGGHSLLLLRVHSRLEERFGRELSIVELFRHPTIRSLARFLAAEATAGAPAMDTAVAP